VGGEPDHAHGVSFALAPLDAELSPEEAAKLLNVSRPYLKRLLRKGEIPFRMVGNRHRVRLVDVLNYKNRIDRERRKVLAELAAEAQELGMGY
jgi:excisionase family DNA binding protein